MDEDQTKQVPVEQAGATALSAWAAPSIMYSGYPSFYLTDLTNRAILKLPIDDHIHTQREKQQTATKEV